MWHFHRRDFASMHRDSTDAAEFLTGAPEDVRIPAEVLVAVLTMAHDRVRAAAALVGSASRMLSLLDNAPRRLIPTARHYRVIGLNNLGVGHLWAGGLDDARTNLTAAGAQAQELGMGLSELTAQAHLSVLEVIHGGLHPAHRRAGTAHQMVDRRGCASEPQTLGLYVALSMTYLAWNRLDEASDTIATGLAASSKGSDTGCRLALGIAAIGVAVGRGDTQAAQSAAARLRVERARVNDLPDLLARWCAVAQAQAHLISGDPEAAIGCVGDPPAESGFAAALERVMLAKAHLALGQLHLIPELLDPLLEPTVPYLGPVVEARILLSLGADRQVRGTAALAAITEAIDLAQPEGLIRPFLDAGPTAAALVARHRHVVSRHLDFTEQLLPQTPAVSRHSALLAPEHLTERELIVLRYLPTLLKAAEIATDLYVSVNTVKSHQRSIYRRFDVTTRQAAVDRARDLNLL